MVMDGNDLKKLKALLAHWIGHSEEHGTEFAEWAEKVNSAQYLGVYKNMSSACKGMEAVKNSLMDALKELNKETDE
jgi:uncharacterized protein YukE